MDFDLDVLTIANWNEERERVHEPCIFLPFLGSIVTEMGDVLVPDDCIQFFDILKSQSCLSILQCTTINRNIIPKNKLLKKIIEY